MTAAILIAFAFCAWCLWAVWPQRGVDLRGCVVTLTDVYGTRFQARVRSNTRTSLTLDRLYDPTGVRP